MPHHGSPAPRFRPGVIDRRDQWPRRFSAISKGTPLPTVITVYQDKSFTFITKTPPATWYLKQAAGIKSGSKLVGRETAGKVTQAQVREIAEAKMKDLNANDMDAAMRIIEGSARAIGLEVVEG
jgi:large subunit ribosomal protein L11